MNVMQITNKRNNTPVSQKFCNILVMRGKIWQLLTFLLRSQR